MLSLVQHRPLLGSGWASVLIPHKQAKCLHVFRYITDKRKKKRLYFDLQFQRDPDHHGGEWHRVKSRKLAVILHW